jgi:hypothetical protein
LESEYNPPKEVDLSNLAVSIAIEDSVLRSGDQFNPSDSPLDKYFDSNYFWKDYQIEVDLSEL